MRAGRDPVEGRSDRRPSNADDSPLARRAATVDEARALAHPLRIQILNVTHGEARTNKEIAARLGELPGTTLHHIRVLAEAGFLEALPARAGRRGAREVPYRATGKSWLLSFGEGSATPVPAGTAIAATAYAQYTESDPASRFAEGQVSLRLTAQDARALAERIHGLVDEYRRERESADGTPVSLMWAFFAPPPAGDPD